MAVTSFGPFRDRMYEALTTSTGKTRALSAGDLFQRGFPPGVDAKARVMRARERPCVFLVMPDIGSNETDPELGSEHIYQLSLVLSRDYFLGWPMTAIEKRSTGFDEVENALVKVADHFPKIRGALAYPAAHDTVTETGASTGLDGRGVKGGGARSTTTITIIEPNSRLVNVQDRFTAWISWAP